jgi:hypothetical protein
MLHRRVDPIPDHALAEPAWWPDHTLIPISDAVCRAILDRALTCLILARGGDLHDPGASISTLASLLAEAQAHLPDAVADARALGYSWDRVAERLGCSISAARHRYADYARCRRQLDLFD